VAKKASQGITLQPPHRFLTQAKYFSGSGGALEVEIGVVGGRQFQKKRCGRLEECTLFPTHSPKLRA